MAKTGRIVVFVTVAVGVISAQRMAAGTPDGEPSNIRFKNDRIGELFDYAMKRSPAFEDVVRTLEQQDRVVYLEEGPCRQPHVTACLQVMPTGGGRYIQIRLDPRQPITSVVAHLAHELYHASEIARDRRAVDADSVRALFERIGYQNKSCVGPVTCWETRAAVAFEALVTRELNGLQPQRVQ